MSTPDQPTATAPRTDSPAYLADAPNALQKFESMRTRRISDMTELWQYVAAQERELSSAQAELAEAKAEIARITKQLFDQHYADTNRADAWRNEAETLRVELARAEARLETPSRSASLVFSPTTGHYTVMQRGTSIVLQDFLKSPAAAEAWCMANGWTLFPSPAIKQLVDACRAALDETANYSGLSDDSEPVLSFETRKILYAALKAAKAAKLFP